jgi:hypothetical protein
VNTEPVEPADAVPRTPRGVSETAVGVLAVVLLIALGASLGSWIVDDAGISLSYARTLGSGHGLIAQPGAERVEGFSDPLWVLLLALAQALGMLDGVWAPKILGAAAAGGALFWLHRRTARETSLLLATCAACAVALQPTVGIWTFSGLETGFYVGAIVALVAATHRWLSTRSGALWLGLAAAACALTRPDGALFATVAGLVVLAGVVHRRPIRRPLRDLAMFALGCLPVLVYQAFRVSYYGDWLPLTARAKGGLSASTIFDVVRAAPEAIRRLLDITTAYAGLLSGWLLVLAAFLVFTIVRRDEPTQESPSTPTIFGPLSIYTVSAVATYLLLPIDWMGEYRFATPALFLLPFWLAFAGARWAGASPRRRERLAACAVVFVGVELLAVAPRWLAFRARPTVPLSVAVERYAVPLTDLSHRLGIPRASVLLPDVGGVFWASDLKVYDLGMLTDRRITETLTANRPAFHDYVFEVARPDWIHTHDWWTGHAALPTDPRFARDYVPVFVYLDPVLRARRGMEVPSGTWLRRERLAGHEALLPQLSAVLAHAHAEEARGEDATRGETQQ